ncbi:MAG: hypothetical protein HDQ97_17460 [Lachnospiraceae bacterium]|nr:hypothetical protein [Lachnospiraceae bacterium]
MSNFIKEFQKNWNKKKYAQCISIVLLITAFAVAIIVVICLLLDMFITFIMSHYQELFLGFGIFFLAFYYIREHFEEKKRAREEQLELARKLQAEADADTLERNYRLIRTCIFSVIRDMSDVLQVKKPIREGEIDSPNHNVEKLNFILYQYIVYRTASTVDTETIREILRKEIARRLDAHLFTGVTQTYYLHEGQTEPIISVYTVEDNNAYLTISVAIADENYCRHIRQGVSLNLLQQAEQLTQPSDNDF